MPTWEERMTRRPDPEPKLLRVATCWELRAPSGRILCCGIYDTDAPGLEVRVGYSEDLLYSRRVIGMEAAKVEAEELRQTVLAKGRFNEL